MTDWIAWTKCPACEHTQKDVFQKPDDADDLGAAPHVRCPKCGNVARYITFPAFEVQTFDVFQPSDALRDEMEDW